MADLHPPRPHDEAHRYARRLVGALKELDLERYILSAQANRCGHIFLDYLRNGRGTTAIGTYSPRAREGFPIAARTTWSQIEAGIQPDAFTMKSLFRAHSKKQNFENAMNHAADCPARCDFHLRVSPSFSPIVHQPVKEMAPIRRACSIGTLQEVVSC